MQVARLKELHNPNQHASVTGYNYIDGDNRSYSFYIKRNLLGSIHTMKLRVADRSTKALAKGDSHFTTDKRDITNHYFL